MEKISYTDCVRNVEFSFLLRVNYERNMLHRMKRRELNWMGCILDRKCFLKHVIDGKRMKGKATGRRRKIRKQQLDGLKKKRGY